MKATLAMYIILIVLVFGPWIGNFVKRTNCDFESPYRCEAIHGFSLIPIASFVTVWFDSDKS